MTRIGFAYNQKPDPVAIHRDKGDDLFAKEQYASTCVDKAATGCTGDSACAAGKKCVQLEYDPCAGQPCKMCSGMIGVCR